MDSTNNTMPNFSPASGGVAGGPAYTPPVTSTAAMGGVAEQTRPTGSGQMQSGAFVSPAAAPVMQTPPGAPIPPVRQTPQAAPVSTTPTAPGLPSVSAPVSPVGKPAGVKPVPAAPGARPVNIDGINGAPMRDGVEDTFATPAHPLEMNAESKPAEAATSINDREVGAINPFSTGAATQAHNVSFADPAEQPIMNTSQQKSVSKKKSNGLLIMLSIIAFVVAAALAAILVMELMGIGPFSGK